MTILTRLFVFSWFKSLFGALAALLVLISTADIINGFLRGKDVSLIFLEWALKMPELTSKVLPATCLLATLFALNHLKTHNELVACFAAGFSTLRATWVITLCSLVIVLVQFLNLGYLEPYANEIERQEIRKSTQVEGKFLTRSAVGAGTFWFKSRDYFATFLMFDKKQAAMANLRLFFFDKNGQTSKIIVANKATHRQGHTWILENGHEVDELSGSRFPRQTPFVKQAVQLNETQADFTEFEADLTTLSFFALGDFIRKVSNTGINPVEYLVLLHQKTALSLQCLVFALLPLGGLYRPGKRSDSFGKNVALTLGLSILFWLLFSAFVSSGNNGKIHPYIATYGVPFLFMIQVLWTIWRNRKLAF